MSPSVLQSEYTFREVTRMLGISARQLQWWSERQIVAPRQERHRRLYTREQIARLMLVRELRRKDISLQRIRQMLRRAPEEIWSAPYLCIARDHLYPGRAIEGILRHFAGSRKPLFLISNCWSNFYFKGD